MHEIGRAANEKYEDFGDAVKYHDEICSGAYLHGLIESRLSESTDVFADMKALCDPYSAESFLGFECYHGLGHGAMFYTANDLPRSLEMCDAFATSTERSSCASGAFMENFNTDQKLHLSEFLREADPFYPCMEQAKRHKSDCYMYAPTYFLSLNNDDYADALVWCRGAEAGFRLACTYGVGAHTMKENMSDPKFVESTCAKGEPRQVAQCIGGMVNMYTVHHAAIEPGLALCSRLETSNQQTCYSTVELVSDWFKT